MIMIAQINNILTTLIECDWTVVIRSGRGARSSYLTEETQSGVQVL